MNRLIRSFLALSLAGGTLAAQQARDTSVAGRIMRIETGLFAISRVGVDSGPPHTLDEWMAAARVPGLSIAVFDHGRLSWARAYGLADVANHVPADTGTLFQAASISKPVATAAMLRLVERGTLSLDQDVNVRLRSWKVPSSDGEAEPAVTLRRIASHTAGLTGNPFPGYEPGHTLPTLPQVLEGASPANNPPVRLESYPGTRWNYSGGGFAVMQMLLEDVTGQPFTYLMDTLVLGPLGMRQSSYAQSLPAALAARAATGYRAAGEAVEGRHHLYPEQAAAGLWTTPSDLARFMLDVGRAYRGEPGAVLDSASARAMLHEVMGGWGLGFAVAGSGDSLRYSHTGATEGYRAIAMGWAARGAGVVIMTNSDAGDQLYMELLRAVAREYGWKWEWPER